jgi:hypothetical protein
MKSVSSRIDAVSRTLRALATLAVGVFGALAVTHTAAYQLRSLRPELAYRLAPYDGRIAALAAAYRSAPGALSEDRRAGDVVASQALRLDPTAVVAASTIGLNAQVRGDVPQARRLFAYAGLLSRGEIQTELWAIEDAVARGNVGDALTHYDIALRSTPTLSQMLFPPLTSASTDPEIRASLIKRLAAKPSWGSDFIIHVAVNTSDPKSAAQFFGSLHRAGVAVPDYARAYLLGTLLNDKATDSAWEYYAMLVPQADRRKSRDPHFAGTMDPPSRLDWVIEPTQGMNASIQRTDRNGIVDFTAPPMAAGPVIQQLQVLPAGSYIVRGHSLGIKKQPDDKLYWSLNCENGIEIGKVDVPDSANSGGRFKGVLNVPVDCPLQKLALMVYPAENSVGVSGQIDYVQLEPAP